MLRKGPCDEPSGICLPIFSFDLEWEDKSSFRGKQNQPIVIYIVNENLDVRFYFYSYTCKHKSHNQKCETYILYKTLFNAKKSFLRWKHLKMLTTLPWW